MHKVTLMILHCHRQIIAIASFWHIKKAKKCTKDFSNFSSSFKFVKICCEIFHLEEGFLFVKKKCLKVNRGDLSKDKFDFCDKV